MPRAQVIAKTDGIEDATNDVDGALTVESCAMYAQALGMLRQIDALEVKVMIAEQSHRRRSLEKSLESSRAHIAAAVEKIYRVACEAPSSRFMSVREAQAALSREAMLFLWPKS